MLLVGCSDHWIVVVLDIDMKRWSCGNVEFRCCPRLVFVVWRDFPLETLGYLPFLHRVYCRDCCHPRRPPCDHPAAVFPPWCETHQPPPRLLLREGHCFAHCCFLTLADWRRLFFPWMSPPFQGQWLEWWTDASVGLTCELENQRRGECRKFPWGVGPAPDWKMSLKTNVERLFQMPHHRRLRLCWLYSVPVAHGILVSILGKTI
mmetsp:Transcript_5632/g.11653  ORF Transcript_5632/g.11653 Transcript_5632/m.11653 type:complete len:205 (-) Transcript_5632:455-1069(-)